MKVSRANLLFSTFIGLAIEVIGSSQRRLVGLKGKVVDETKNLLVIEKADGKEVKIPKASCQFRFTVDDGTVAVDGSRIAFRHFERPKKVSKDAII
ncbi:MAG: ribonuclease P protein subunit [Candidatus Micrarchaeota archaeon]